MVKRVHRKKDICSLEAASFVDFKEAAKPTYDRYVSYFAATLTPYFSRVCFCFFTTILFKCTAISAIRNDPFHPSHKKLFFECVCGRGGLQEVAVYQRFQLRGLD